VICSGIGRRSVLYMIRWGGVTSLFCRWDVSIICPVTVFTRLPFPTLWPNWLDIFLSFKIKFFSWPKKAHMWFGDMGTFWQMLLFLLFVIWSCKAFKLYAGNLQQFETDVIKKTQSTRCSLNGRFRKIVGTLTQGRVKWNIPNWGQSGLNGMLPLPRKKHGGFHWERRLRLTRLRKWRKNLIAVFATRNNDPWYARMHSQCVPPIKMTFRVTWSLPTRNGQEPCTVSQQWVQCFSFFKEIFNVFTAIKPSSLHFVFGSSDLMREGCFQL